MFIKAKNHSLKRNKQNYFCFVSSPSEESSEKKVHHITYFIDYFSEINIQIKLVSF